MSKREIVPGPPAKWPGTPPDPEPDSPYAERLESERLAEIGRAVVEHYFPNDPRAARDATPGRVLERIQRTENELRWLASSDALQVGRLALTLRDALTAGARS